MPTTRDRAAPTEVSDRAWRGDGTGDANAVEENHAP